MSSQLDTLPVAVAEPRTIGSKTLAAAFLIGMLAPTSINGTFRLGVDLGYAVVAVVFLIAFRPWLTVPATGQLVGVTVWALGLLAGTATSPFAGAYVLGLAPTMVGVGLVLLCRPGDLRVSNTVLRRAVRFVAVVYAVWVVGLLAPLPLVQLLTARLYPDYYQELVTFMVEIRHPVTAWGTHSAAGLAFFLLFVVFYVESLYAPRRSSIPWCLFWIVAMVSLRSSSGVFLAAIALLWMFVPWAVTSVRQQIRRHSQRMMMWAGLVVTIGFVLLAPIVFELVRRVLDTNVGGFSGRYSRQSGRLFDTIRWIQRHPFRPIGFTESPTIAVGDSGIINSYLRGNYLSLLGQYSALFLMFRQFLNRRLALQLFLAFALFDLGFEALPIWRLQLVLIPVLFTLRSIIVNSNVDISAPNTRSVC